MAKKIALTGKYGEGKFALVDNSDYGWASVYKWYAISMSSGLYVARYKRGVSSNYPLHREILGRLGHRLEGLHVDHVNRNPLDNRRSNIRPCTIAQNQHNRIATGGSSKYKGVSLNDGKWRAEIAHNGVKHYLGRFCTEEDAGLAYDAAARVFHGDFARLNFPTPDEANRQAA